jgi:hypothetical protein
LFLNVGEEKTAGNVLNAIRTVYDFIGVEHGIAALAEPERNVNVLGIIVAGIA